MTFQALATQILAKPCPHPVRLIAVDGCAGTGKSTFAAQLAASLGGAPIIQMDDFSAWDDLTEYWPRFEAQVLTPLMAGRSLRYQKRDWQNDWAGRSLGAWCELPFSPVLILEGMGSARQAVASRLCFAIWIATSAHVRLERGIARDKRDLPGKRGQELRKIWEGFMPGEKAFFEADGTELRADLRVDGENAFGENFRTLNPLRSSPSIKTPRLRLRPWLDSDLAALAAINADPSVMEHFPRPLTQDESAAFIAQANANLSHRGFGFWALEAVDEAGCFGFVGLAEPSFEAAFTPCVEIGWRLKREAWGRGYATEAAAAVLGYAWDLLGLKEVVAFTSKSNVRSIKVMERLGMQRDPNGDFAHPKLPAEHRLSAHVLYRVGRDNGPIIPKKETEPSFKV